MHLSDMSGVALAEALRADAAWLNIGFILTTSETDSDVTARIAGDRRTTIMPKPFDLNRLKQAITTVIG
jgi:CheY-like chemotaxis protein